MTCQVQFKTKKALKEAVHDGRTIEIYDPSIMSDRVYFYAAAMEVGQSEVVTKQPERKWFANIEMTPKGLVVS